MSSPLPPDPYEALGVTKDADIGTIRVAHRKLALKHHPDRIRDEADREKGKHEFQRIQQAYEILSDPNRRARYDDRMRLIELRKERMMRQASQPTPSMPTTTARPREQKTEEVYYEFVGRVIPPQTTYFDRDPYEDHIPRAAARKSDSYEKKSTPPKVERREKLSSKVYGPAEGISHRITAEMKARATEAKLRTKEKQRQNAEVRDKEKRRQRSEKHSRHAAYVEDESESDYETITPDYFSKSRSEARYRSSEAEAESIRGPIPRPSRRYQASYDDEDSLDESEKWERLHKNSRDYIADSQRRPGMTRSGSDAHVYWAADGRSSRKSGSDNDKRTSGTTKTRRSTADEARARPSMPVHTSAPSNLRSHVDREPSRSKTSSYPTDRDSRREPPSLPRSQTMPVRAKKDSNAPSRGSNLKHEAQPDSGYYSSSSPHTPEMRGDSPPRDHRDAPREQAKRTQSSVKYTIVDPENDEDAARGPRLNRTRILTSDDDRRRIFHSPERDNGRDKDRDSDRERPRDRTTTRPRLQKLDTESGRSRAGRTPPTVSRPEFARYDSQSPREAHPVNRKKFFGEIGESTPPSSYNSPPLVRTSSHRGPTVFADYRNSSPDEYASDSRFGRNHPTTSRRASAANAY